MASPTDARPTIEGDLGYLPSLDGWRAVAIGLVLAGHGRGAAEEYVTPLGGLGVTLFFGLSGFLICTRLLAEYRSRGRLSLKTFYVRRAFRILPAAWLYLTVVGLLSGLSIVTASGWEVVASLTFVRNYYWPNIGWYTGHFWSLAVEEHFYLLLPPFLVIVRPRAAAWLLPAWAFAVVGWRFAVNRWGLAGDYTLGGTPIFLSDTRLDSLLWGCWAAVMVHRLDGLPAQRWWGYAQWLLVPLTVGAFMKQSSVNVRFTFPPVLIAALLVGTTYNPASWATRALEFAPLRYIGRISYSLYLWQQLFMFSAFTGAVSELGPLQLWPWNLLATVVAAVISYYAVERPMIAAGRRFWPGAKVA